MAELKRFFAQNKGKWLWAVAAFAICALLQEYVFPVLLLIAYIKTVSFKKLSLNTVSIPGVFLFDGYISRYGLEDWARQRYATLTKKASDCIGCGICETRCPYNLPIREMMKTAAIHFGE